MRVWRSRSEEVYDKSTQGTCGLQHVAIFIRLAVIASQICEIPRNSAKFYENSNLQTFKVIQGHWSWCQSKAICNFLLTLDVLPFSKYWRLKLENNWFFPPHCCLGNPLEFRDETYPQKLKGMGLRYGENFIILTSPVLYDTPVWQRHRRNNHGDRGRQVPPNFLVGGTSNVLVPQLLVITFSIMHEMCMKHARCIVMRQRSM